MFLPSKKERSHYLQQAKIHQNKKADENTPRVEGVVFSSSSGELRPRPSARPSASQRSIAPIVRPHKPDPETAERPEITVPEAPESHGALTTKSLKGAQDADLLKPSGVFASSGSPQSYGELLDPKSSAWGSKLNVKELRSQTIIKPHTDLGAIDRVHSKPSYNGIRTGYTSPAKAKAKKESVAKLDRLTEMLSGLDTHDFSQEEDFNVPGLTVDLKPHQEYGVQFLIHREGKVQSKKERSSSDSDSKSPVSKRPSERVAGGLLCDAMGLGKTVQAIALILKNQPPVGFKGVKTTLVVAPLSLTEQWRAEIRAKAPKLNVLLYLGAARKQLIPTLSSHDVVITTYETILSEYNPDVKAPKNSFMGIKWWRIVADEMHDLRNPSSKKLEALSKIECSKGRWVLTGTPYHNGMDDLFSYFHFLRAAPLNNRKYWSDMPKRTSQPIITEYLHALMLRRPQSILGGLLPKIETHDVKVDFSPEDQKTYNWILHSPLNFLKKLTHLRQTCDDPELVPLEVRPEERSNNISQEPNAKSDLAETGSDEAGSVEDAMSINDLARSFARAKLNEEDVPPVKMSSKTKEILKVIKQDLSRKVVVFSSFRQMTLRIARALIAQGIQFQYYDGSLSSEVRAGNLEKFKTEPDVVVLLATIQTGAVGLNITEASRVIFVDPWWNPMIADQATGRVYRLGQTRKVDVYNMTIRNSLEERIMVVQQRKRKAAHNLLNAKLTKEEREYLLYGNKAAESKDNVLSVV